jgi:metalloendopeptidase OMA1, mitochondrial
VFVTDLIARPCRFWIFCIAIVVISAALPGCTPPPDNGGTVEGPGGRREILALTPQQEVKLGTEAFQEVLTQSRGHVIPVDDPRTLRVKRVAEKIFDQALHNDPLDREIGLHLKGWDWSKRDYRVLDKKEVNAFCLPAGKVVVYTGLLQFAGDNDDKLATVLGHEISHALAHHASERIAREHMYHQSVNAMEGLNALTEDDNRQKLVALLGAGMAAYPQREASPAERPGLFAQIRDLSYDRQQESEADHIGVFLMTFADYDPRQAVVFWEEMQQRSGGANPPEILSDHPSDARRVAQMRVWAGRAHDAWLAWKAGNIAPARDK